MKKYWLISLLSVVLLSGCVNYKQHESLKTESNTLNSKAKTEVSNHTVSGTVIRVVDGDTVHVRVNGKDEDVRILLTDTPETVSPTKPVEPFGPKAHKFAEKMMPAGKKVKLEFDGPKRGKYNRLLAYVWIDGKDYNKLLLEKGLARYAYVYNPPYVHADEFKKAQAEAKKAGIGIWSINGYVDSNGYNLTYACSWAKKHHYADHGCNNS